MPNIKEPFKQENYEYLLKLSLALRKKDTQVVTALVTADSQENAESKLLELCEDSHLDETISCIGKERLTGFKSSAFSLCV